MLGFAHGALDAPAEWLGRGFSRPAALLFCLAARKEREGGERRIARNSIREALARFAYLIGVAPVMAMAGCASLGIGQSTPQLEQNSIQKVEYYPYLVKGYQNSFPHRSILILEPVDARPPGNANAPSSDGKTAIGVTTGRSENVLQRLSSDPLSPIGQDAITHSAEEAGLLAIARPQEGYDPNDRGADYVLASRIVRCWVKRHRGPHGDSDEGWMTEASFALEVIIYRTPFKVPFWEGTSSTGYHDPPIGRYGLGTMDEPSIYEHPGEDLSIAMTRAVAGIFERQDLRTLILNDHISSP